MARLTFRDFSKYLSLSLPEDEIPVNALRRARGVHNIKTLSARSRQGSTLISSTAARSFIYFLNSLYIFTGDALVKDGTTLLSITGDTLSFLSFPPSSEKRDSLFISNGSALYKMSQSGIFTQWGIDAPIDGFTAAASAALTVAFGGMIAGNITCTASTTGTALNGAVVDYSIFSDGSESSDADYITVDINIDVPANLEAFRIVFSLGDTSYTDTLTYETLYTVTAADIGTTDSSSTVAGIGTTSDYATAEQEQDTQTALQGRQDTENVVWASPGEGYWTTNTSYASDIRTAIQSTAIRTPGTWTTLRIAKSSFTRGGTGAYDWSDIKSMKLQGVANANGAISIDYSIVYLSGGNGMQGDYKYYITYFNEDTGNRSNPNPTPVTITNVLRQEVVLSSLPVSSDSQVTHLEIWRTVGDGSVPFYAARVANGVTTFTDTVADMYALDPRDDALYLSSTAIIFTNIVPFSTFGYCAGMGAVVFWTNRDTANTGNLYYSSTGFAEANEGFVRCTTTNDPLQRPVVWNGTLFAFSVAHLFRITGTNPYYSAEVYGVPGSAHPETIVGTPYGIMYQAADGIRLFNGVRSERAGWPQLSKLLSGENVENLTSFTGKCATWGKNEYIISDGSQTLAYSVLDDTWRDLGLGFDYLYTDPLTGYVYGGNADGVYRIEIPGVFADEGSAIPFSIQTKQIRLDVDKEVMVNHIFFDVNTAGQQLVITLITDQGNIDFGVLNTAKRSTIPMPVGKSYNRIGVRLEGSLTAQIELFGIEINAEVSDVMLRDKYFKSILSSID